MARIELLILGVGLAIVVGLVVAFASVADGINQDQEDLANAAATAKAQRALDSASAGSQPPAEATALPDVTPEAAASPPADIVAPTVAADAPVVLGSVSMLTNTAREYLQLDFNACAPGEGALDVRTGKLFLKMSGRDGSNCLLDYSGDVADPAGTLTVTCSVPSRLGKVKLTAREDGADFGPIASYCNDLEAAN